MPVFFVCIMPFLYEYPVLLYIDGAYHPLYDHLQRVLATFGLVKYVSLMVCFYSAPTRGGFCEIRKIINGVQCFVSLQVAELLRKSGSLPNQSGFCK